MTTWQEPTGRERAIEALMDRDKDGDYFRVRKVMEEAVPAALNSRPNKVTKAALVDQAFCLQEYVIDSATSHALQFGREMPRKLSEDQASLLEMKSHVWKHQSSLRDAKQPGLTRVSPPPALYRTLESFLKSKAGDLKRFITKHSLIEHGSMKKGGADTGSSDTESSEPKEYNSTAACEEMVNNLTKLIDTEESDKVYSGMWITILSILMLDQQSSDIRDEERTQEASTSASSSAVGAEAMPPLFLQIGALLPFFRVPPNEADEGKSGEEADDPNFDLDPHLLSYFAKAASVYQERLEIIDARKQLLASNLVKSNDDNIETSFDVSATHSQEQVDDEDANQAIENEASTFSEQTGEAANWETQQESGSDEDDNNEETGVANDSPAEEVDPQSSDGSESSSSSGGSSSSSSDEQNDDSQPEIPEAAAFVESERDISTDDDDDAVLREALGISLGRDEGTSEAVRVILADSVVPMEDESMALHSAVETPVSEDASASANVVSEEENDPLDEPTSGEGDEEIPLPQLPIPPVLYPWKQPRDTNSSLSGDGDTSQGYSSPMDPSNLSDFSCIPSSCALLHLLKYAELVMQRHDATANLVEPPFRTVPGGMGHELFSMKKDSRQDTGHRNSLTDGVSVFQLLLTTVLCIAEKRAHAVEQFYQTSSREKMATRGGDNTSHASGEEQDDPALTFALNYVEDDVSLTVESLENKGMRRKAAAAAHDAEALLKTLRKRTAAWKSYVVLYSRCLLASLKCLTSFLQCITRVWLNGTMKGGRRQSSNGLTVQGLNEFLPPECVSRLSEVLSTLMENLISEPDEALCVQDIYFAALSAWSECVPFLYSSVTEKTGLLSELLDEVKGADFATLKDLDGMPQSSEHGQLLKLRCVSRRMRVKDVIETFIPALIPWMMEGPEGGNVGMPNQESQWLWKLGSTTEPSSTSETVFSSSALIMKFASAQLACADVELRKCFYALCHRMHSVAIMFDGLYAATETETEKTSNMTSHKNKDGPGNGVVLNKTPSSSFVFDVTKCSDSIAILTGFDSAGGNGSTALQRASKVWGTVHSSQYFKPKTGVHRWAVRLDKCERGHVFVGVATARANVRTYVGGDKHGWGMIGTQTLWHDRRKIRGDYGSSFRTGSIVIVTLDTNLGTISLGLWRDAPAGSQDPLAHTLLSPRRQGRAGTIEDWGIAFEGLPLDARMYPAVGLYQRDDRVTLLSVDSDVNGKSGSMDLIGGKSFFPPFDHNTQTSLKEKYEQVRLHNSLVNWDGTEYVAKILERAVDMLNQTPEFANNVLPSVLASLCLLPGSVPVLSQRSAVSLLPHIRRCLEAVRSRHASDHGQVQECHLIEGEWVIRATSGDGDLEEYIVKFEATLDEENKYIGFEGSGIGTTGKSKNGLVSIYGVVKGLSISFLEEWSDEGNKGANTRDDSSSCVVHGTISLDGTRLEGRYRNMEFGTTGKVAGIRKRNQDSQQFDGSERRAVNMELLLCLAHSHLAAVVSDDAAKDGLTLLADGEALSISEPHLASLAALLKKPFLSDSSFHGSSDWLGSHMTDLVKLYAPPSSSSELCGMESGYALENLKGILAGSNCGDVCNFDKLTEMVEDADVVVSKALGKRGSLSAINPGRYNESRKGVICALLFHCNLIERLTSFGDEKDMLVSDQSIVLVWQTALLIMEDGIREALSDSRNGIGDSFKQRCDVISVTSKFLLDLEIDPQICDIGAASDIRQFYMSVNDESSILFLKQKMKHATASSALQLIALQSTKEVLSNSLTSVGTESVALGLCKLMAQLPGGLAASRRADSKSGQRHLPGGSGADVSVRRQMSKSLSEMFLFFLNQTDHVVRHRGGGAVRDHSDSFVLASLCVFMLCLDGTGVQGILVSFLSKMKDVLAQYRPALDTIDRSRAEEGHVTVVKTLTERDVAYAILRCATAAVHVCFYQLSNDSADMDGSVTIEYPVNWFRSELARGLTYLEDVFGKLASKRVEACGLEEWERWIHREERKVPDKVKRGRIPAFKNGPHSLIDVGTIQHLDFNSGPKSSFRHEGRKYSGGPEHRHLSHWLHILRATIRKDSPFRECLLNDTALASILLRVLGVDHVRATSTGQINKVEIRRRDKGLLPARYRARIAFFLGLGVMQSMSANPDLIEGLFYLAGLDLLATGADEEEYLVSREAVSLLRKLFSPENEPWRQCITGVLSSLMRRKSVVKRLGLHSFLSGIVTSVARLSFVLLKPVVAAPLNHDGGRISSSGIHTMIPVGADAVVSGLMRSSAEGGIISNIDDKNGICEVILISRSEETDGDDVVGGGSNNLKRHGLTVRALRTPVADVILAQEVPLHLDDRSIPSDLISSMLEETLDSLLSAVSPDSPALTSENGMDKTPGEDDPPSLGTESESDRARDQTSEQEPHERIEDGDSSLLASKDVPEHGRESATSFEEETGPSPSGTREASSPPPSKTSEPTSATEQSGSILSSKGESSLHGIGSGVYGLSLDVMTIRSAIVILSNEEIVKRFMDDKRCSTIFLKILHLAWPEEKELSKSKDSILGARQADITCLPLHETKMCHMMLMLRSLFFREQVLLKTPGDVWTSRVAEYASIVKKLAETDHPVLSSSTSDARVSNPDGPSNSNRNTSQSNSASQSEEEEDDQDEASALAAQHLREAAIAQMGELGIPRSYAELALRRIGGTNIEAAVHFCLENGSEIERLLAEEIQRQASEHGGRTRPREDSHLLQQLMEMGFPRRWCTEALSATGNNVDEALTWILNNNETLESLDASDEEEEEEEEEDASADAGGDEDEDESEDESEDGNQDSKENTEGVATSFDREPGWMSPVTPLKVVSGRASIDSSSLEVSGQSSGGFASVGVKGILLKSGKWYYEVILGTAGCIQLGFGDASFAGHCNADRGDGCGDSSSSFSFDGWRRLRWHMTATEWGCRWKEGDVIGCMVDIDERVMSFTLNGEGESIGMGVAFTGFSFCGGLYPVVSFNRRERLRLILGGSGAPFRFAPPDGYRGVGEALLASVEERDILVRKEDILGLSGELSEGQKYLPDFSDEEHGNELFSWSHRYYGSDASVHLGSSRTKATSGDASQVTNPAEQVSRRVDGAWCNVPRVSCETGRELLDTLVEGYKTVHAEIAYDVFVESVCSAVILCRKLLFHAIISTGHFNVSKFSHFRSEPTSILNRLWKVIETACSVKNWSGEAGAMAMAAEALGLGIQLQSRHGFERLGVSSEELVAARPAFTQLLTSLMRSHPERSETSNLFAAAAEWNGGPAVFLRHGIESAIAESEDFCRVVLSSARRSVRLLAGIEDSDARSSHNTEDEAESSGVVHEDKLNQPDARFLSFVTGILLNARINAPFRSESLEVGLFQAWSVGLLSASLPWRMVSALTVSTILERTPTVFAKALTPTLARFYGRLHGTLARRAWAERAAYPICSRYFQAMLELLFSVRKSVKGLSGLPDYFSRYWGVYEVEASSPRCLPSEDPESMDWQSEEGWIANEEVWTGHLIYDELSWSKPGRSSVRPLTDGEGPPMLREGCTVMRGPDWPKASNRNEDGFDVYETAKKKRDHEVKLSKDASSSNEDIPKSEYEESGRETAELPKSDASKSKDEEKPEENPGSKKAKKKIPHPKLPLGRIVSIEPWNGVPAVGRRVRWQLTGDEEVYRFGGDGGKHDIVHVETNGRGTKVIKKYPFPETSEQCAARRGFGTKKSYSLLLRFKRPLDTTRRMTSAIMELPDFGAAVKVSVRLNSDGSVAVREEEILFGSKDSGWEARFGQPSFVPGSEYTLRVKERHQSQDLMSPFSSFSENMEGTSVFKASVLRNPENGMPLKVSSTMRITRGRRDREQTIPSGCFPSPLVFDKNCHAANLTVSKDGRSVACTSTDGRGCAFAEIGFSKGFHYWEVKIESCESGSIFIGCSEKPPTEGTNRFNRWLGWGFVNFRATYTSGSEKVYGVHANAGDTVGVVLDCDAGRVAFFYDGLKYGEHIINDLGCAFENLSPFGFSVEGCGTGGQGQGATSGFPRSPAQGFVRPKTLYPVVGLRNHGDRVTLRPGWTSTFGVDGPRTIENVLGVLDTVESYIRSDSSFPAAIVDEGFHEYQKWCSESSRQTISRGNRVYRIEMDTSAAACATASAALGLTTVLLPGDRLKLKRSAGRKLELAEDAVILGQHQLRLYYKIVAQKNEGQSLTEGGELPHFFEECDMVDGVEFVTSPEHTRPELPLLDRFKWRMQCGLKVVYSGGAVIRGDLEINDASPNLGTVPAETIIAPEDIIERRVNSCGVVRFRVRFGELEGYISANIRGGTEEPIVQVDCEDIESVVPSANFPTPYECADKWLRDATALGLPFDEQPNVRWRIPDKHTFKALLARSCPKGVNTKAFDEKLVAALSALGDSTVSADTFDCKFSDVVFAFSGTFDVPEDTVVPHTTLFTGSESAATMLTKFDSLDVPLPCLDAVLARLAVLRVLNMRAQFALPWIPLRPAQEGSALLGGLHGLGTPVDKAGRATASLRDRKDWLLSSLPMKMRSCRGLFFTSVKRALLSNITEVTTTPTPLSHDEYELPREIRTVRINRMRAARAMESSDVNLRRKYSLFFQIMNETKSWGGAALRRGYVAKGHGGQKRAFKVKFVGEGVNDYSGPYREVFAEAMNEVLKLDAKGNGVLAVLEPSPNTLSAIGEDQGLYVFSSNGQNLLDLKPLLPVDGIDKRELHMRDVFASLLSARNEATREVEEALVFLGRLTGTAYRHGIQLDLPLPQSTFWNMIVETEDVPSSSQLEEIDVLAAKGNQATPILWWQKRMLNFFVEGLSNVIPVEILPLFCAHELQDTLCGSSDVDVETLKRVVEYEGYDGDEPVIQNFWTVLRESTSHDRKAFLQYVWARSRLPSRVADFETPFKIIKDTANSGERADMALPSASTCFFSLTLPMYSSVEILRQKLLFAIHNVTTMETDFQTNLSEVAEGYRALAGVP